MRKEIVRTGNGRRDRALTFIPDRAAHYAARIVKEFSQDGTRFYQDSERKLHLADVYDRVFGKPRPELIDLKARDGFSRYQTLR